MCFLLDFGLVGGLSHLCTLLNLLGSLLLLRFLGLFRGFLNALGCSFLLLALGLGLGLLLSLLVLLLFLFLGCVLRCLVTLLLRLLLILSLLISLLLDLFGFFLSFILFLLLLVLLLVGILRLNFLLLGILGHLGFGFGLGLGSLRLLLGLTLGCTLARRPGLTLVLELMLFP